MSGNRGWGQDLASRAETERRLKGQTGGTAGRALWDFGHGRCEVKEHVWFRVSAQNRDRQAPGWAMDSRSRRGAFKLQAWSYLAPHKSTMFLKSWFGPVLIQMNFCTSMPEHAHGRCHSGMVTGVYSQSMPRV